jgi:hypothetical protein
MSSLEYEFVALLCVDTNAVQQLFSYLDVRLLIVRYGKCPTPLAYSEKQPVVDQEGLCTMKSYPQNALVITCS